MTCNTYTKCCHISFIKEPLWVYNKVRARLPEARPRDAQPVSCILCVVCAVSCVCVCVVCAACLCVSICVSVMCVCLCSVQSVTCDIAAHAGASQGAPNILLHHT